MPYSGHRAWPKGRGSMDVDWREDPGPGADCHPTDEIPRVAENRPGPLLWALSFVVLSFGVMQTMLVPSIGVLQREFDTTAAAASWAVLSATMLVSAIVTPLIGRLGDRFGKRRVLLWSLWVYLAGTVGAIFAPNLALLIGFRAVQGIGLALLPLTFAIVREALPARYVPFGLGLTSGLVGGTAGLGLLIGGTLVDYSSWRWLFVVCAGVVVVAVVLTIRFVPESSSRAAGGIDIAGTLVLAAGLVALLLGITQGAAWGWFSPAVLGLFAAAIAILALFVVIEKRRAHPVIDIGLLTHRPLLIAHLGALALGINQFLFYVLLPRLSQLPNGLPPEAVQWVTYGFATTVTGAALIVLPGTLMTLPASWSANRVERGFGMRAPLVLGLGLAAVAATLMAVAHGQIWQLVVFNMVASAGHGFAMAALPRLVNAATEPTQSASANGINTVSRILGGAVGTQIASAMLTTVTIDSTPYPAEWGFTLAFILAAVVGAAGALLGPLARTVKSRNRNGGMSGSSPSRELVHSAR